MPIRVASKVCATPDASVFPRDLSRLVRLIAEEIHLARAGGEVAIFVTGETIPMTTSTLPQVLRPYFWDTDFDKLDLLAHRRFIAERLLEKTTPDTFRFLLENFSRSELRRIAEGSRRLHARDRDFWRLYLAET